MAPIVSVRVKQLTKERDEVELSVGLTDDGVAIVDVGGSVDVYTATAFRDGLDQQIQQGHTRVVVDLDDVEFLDSTGLGVLVARLKLIRHQNGWMRLVCTSEKVLRVFRITGLDKVFLIHASVAEALSAASEQSAANTAS